MTNATLIAKLNDIMGDAGYVDKQLGLSGTVMDSGKLVAWITTSKEELRNAASLATKLALQGREWPALTTLAKALHEAIRNNP